MSKREKFLALLWIGFYLGMGGMVLAQTVYPFAQPVWLRHWPVPTLWLGYIYLLLVSVRTILDDPSLKKWVKLLRIAILVILHWVGLVLYILFYGLKTKKKAGPA